jgi:hypothetical protein
VSAPRRIDMTEPNDAQRQLFQRVAERLQQHDFKGWFYGDSVGFEGLIAAGDMLGLSAPGRISRRASSAPGPRGARRGSSMTTPRPGHVMCEIVKRTGDEVLLKAVIELAEHLYSRRRVRGVAITFEDTLRALRQPYGGTPLDAAAATADARSRRRHLARLHAFRSAVLCPPRQGRWRRPLVAARRRRDPGVQGFAL